VHGDGADSPIAAILRYADMFNGGAIANASVFGLGIMPYISASIIMQLLTFSFPALKALQKEGEGGRRKLNQYTRYATLLICVVQACLAALALYNMPPSEKGGASLVDPSYSRLGFVFQSGMIITTGSMVLLWISEQITKFGIGNGVSIIIMIGILSSIPGAFSGGEHDLGNYLLIIGVSLSIIAAIVVVVQATRRIPLEQQRRIQGNRVYGGSATVLPLKLNQANVIPVIFASPVMVVIGYAISSQWVQGGALLGYGTPGYRLAFASLIIAFTYFYISITFDLNEMANHFKQAGFFVRGIKPGKKTVDFLQYHLVRITLVGAVFLALIAIMPDLLDHLFNLSGRGGRALMGGTGLLIVVGVALDVMQKVSSFFLAHQYQGLAGGNADSAGSPALAGSAKKPGKRF
jgi:preprotein translocase subunit SecY